MGGGGGRGGRGGRGGGGINLNVNLVEERLWTCRLIFQGDLSNLNRSVAVIDPLSPSSPPHLLPWSPLVVASVLGGRGRGEEGEEGVNSS